MDFVRETIELPDDGKKLLLHSYCAPCSSEVMEAIIASEIEFSVFFYNPNIHPKKEYDLCKEENIRFAEKYNIPFIDADYDVDNWFNRAQVANKIASYLSWVEHGGNHEHLFEHAINLCG